MPPYFLARIFPIAMRNNLQRNLKKFSIFKSWNYNSSCGKNEDKFGAWYSAQIHLSDRRGQKKERKYTLQKIFGVNLVLLIVPQRQTWPNLKGLVYLLKLNLIQVTFMPLGCATNVLNPKAGSREGNKRLKKIYPTKRWNIFSKGVKTNVYWANLNLGPSLKQISF